MLSHLLCTLSIRRWRTILIRNISTYYSSLFAFSLLRFTQLRTCDFRWRERKMLFEKAFKNHVTAFTHRTNQWARQLNMRTLTMIKKKKKFLGGKFKKSKYYKLNFSEIIYKQKLRLKILKLSEIIKTSVFTFERDFVGKKHSRLISVSKKDLLSIISNYSYMVSKCLWRFFDIKSGERERKREQSLQDQPP